MTTTDARVRVYYKLTLWAWRLRWAKNILTSSCSSINQSRRRYGLGWQQGRVDSGRVGQRGLCPGRGSWAGPGCPGPGALEQPCDVICVVPWSHLGNTGCFLLKTKSCFTINGQCSHLGHGRLKELSFHQSMGTPHKICSVASEVKMFGNADR